MQRLALSALLAFGAVACSTASPEDEAECQVDDHCPGEVCRSNRCVAEGCGDGGACPAGQVCTAAGVCQGAGNECRTDPDCGANGRCVEGECFGCACQDGEERECRTACGVGVERCRSCVWTGVCSAGEPTDEICGDGRDNDCDGEADPPDLCVCGDGEQRECMTDCGMGVERCLDRVFQGCTAPRPRTELCGNEVDEDCDGTVDEMCGGCTPGETRACESECGRGVETCGDDELFRCDAPVPVDELCDGLDNDCDMAIDEEITRDCRTACGPGFEGCTDGAWMGCDAPEQCACDVENRDTQVCGTCGTRERECVGGMWSDWGACDESGGSCGPGTSESVPCGRCGMDRRTCTAECEWGPFLGCNEPADACEPGTQESEACPGGCGGMRTRTCGDGCTWGEWSDCGGGMGDGCMPGALDEQPCGSCGTRVRRCGDDCNWGEFAECGGEGFCAPGEEQGEACNEGNGSTRVRVCGDACMWGDFGECMGGGLCAEGDREERECGNCGRQRRFCNADFVWDDWSECQGAGPCQPGDSERQNCGPDTDEGTCEFGSQVRTCDQACQWSDFDACRGAVLPANDICGDSLDQDCDGSPARDEDQYEPNDSCGDCWEIPGVDPDDFLIRATHDFVGDRADYYCFTAEDGINFGLREFITISLTDIPNGTDYDLFLYEGLAGCNARTPTASSAEFNNDDDEISWGERFNHPDDGVWVVEVRRAVGHSCGGQYSLTIDGLR